MGEDAARIIVRIAERGFEGIDSNLLESMNPELVFSSYARTLINTVNDLKASKKLKDYDKDYPKKAENIRRLQKDVADILGSVSGLNLTEITRIMDAVDFYSEE